MKKNLSHMTAAEVAAMNEGLKQCDWAQTSKECNSYRYGFSDGLGYVRAELTKLPMGLQEAPHNPSAWHDGWNALRDRVLLLDPAPTATLGEVLRKKLGGDEQDVFYVRALKRAFDDMHMAGKPVAETGMLVGYFVNQINAGRNDTPECGGNMAFGNGCGLCTECVKQVAGAHPDSQVGRAGRLAKMMNEDQASSDAFDGWFEPKRKLWPSTQHQVLAQSAWSARGVYEAERRKAEPPSGASEAAIEFALTAEEGMTWLRLWNEGEFEACRSEWPEAPPECYIGADQLYVPPEDYVGGIIPTPQPTGEEWDRVSEKLAPAEATTPTDDDDGPGYEISAANAARVLRNTGYAELAKFVSMSYPENILHKAIEPFVSKRNQGKVMGALRSVLSTYDPRETQLRMTNKMRAFIEGMSVSVDVSTGEHDAHHRYFGKISEVMDDPEDKHGVTLLVQNAEPNFKAQSVQPTPPTEPNWVTVPMIRAAIERINERVPAVIDGAPEYNLLNSLRTLANALFEIGKQNCVPNQYRLPGDFRLVFNETNAPDNEAPAGYVALSAVLTLLHSLRKPGGKKTTEHEAYDKAYNKALGHVSERVVEMTKLDGRTPLIADVSAAGPDGQFHKLQVLHAAATKDGIRATVAVPEVFTAARAAKVSEVSGVGPDGNFYELPILFVDVKKEGGTRVGIEFPEALDPKWKAMAEDMLTRKLQVWEGEMPETNGKTNYTAILHRGNIHEGITIDRSEYPDRVHYEADRMRWLIGDRSEQPDITQYDANKHSGYKEPEPEFDKREMHTHTATICRQLISKASFGNSVDKHTAIQYVGDLDVALKNALDKVDKRTEQRDKATVKLRRQPTEVECLGFLSEQFPHVMDFKRSTVIAAIQRFVAKRTYLFKDSDPRAQWEDPDVQLVYDILCEGETPPEGEHWEGFTARRIVDALAGQASTLPAAVVGQVQALVAAVNEVQTGVGIHNSRFPDRKLEGPVWDALWRARNTASMITKDSKSEDYNAYERDWNKLVRWIKAQAETFPELATMHPEGAIGWLVVNLAERHERFADPKPEPVVKKMAPLQLDTATKAQMARVLIESGTPEQKTKAAEFLLDVILDGVFKDQV